MIYKHKKININNTCGIKSRYFFALIIRPTFMKSQMLPEVVITRHYFLLKIDGRYFLFLVLGKS